MTCRHAVAVDDNAYRNGTGLVCPAIACISIENTNDIPETQLVQAVFFGYALVKKSYVIVAAGAARAKTGTHYAARHYLCHADLEFIVFLSDVHFL